LREGILAEWVPGSHFLFRRLKQREKTSRKLRDRTGEIKRATRKKIAGKLQRVSNNEANLETRKEGGAPNRALKNRRVGLNRCNGFG